MSDKDPDGWTAGGVGGPSATPKRAKMPARPATNVRKLVFCTDKSPERVLNALEDADLYRKTDTLRALAGFLANGLTNAGWAVWKALKPYHANLLAYQFAAGIQAGTLVAPTDVIMIRSCYDIIINIFERFNNDSDRPTYTQWVARQTVDEMTNMDIIFRFLRKHDPQIAKMAGPGKLR